MKFKEYLEAADYGLPSVNKLGSTIADKFNLRKSSTKFDQLDPNCYEIAAELANELGYRVPSFSELSQMLDDIALSRMQKLWGGEPLILPFLKRRSLAHLIVRQGKSLDSIVGQTHVTFEYKGREYNYGAHNKNHDHNFQILFKVPLNKKET